MAVTYKAVATIWIMVFGLFAFSGSGTIVGSRAALVASSGLVMATILLIIAGMLRKGSDAAADAAHIRVLADADDVMRMDSDKG